LTAMVTVDDYSFY